MKKVEMHYMPKKSTMLEIFLKKRQKLSSPFRFSSTSVYKITEKMYSCYSLHVSHNIRTQGSKEIISKQEVFFPKCNALFRLEKYSQRMLRRPEV